MFCPNCGTENEESLSTCKKCGFNLKGAAAPKFKGTMLMMNAPSGVPRPGAATATPAPAAANVPAKLKGTMLGVAPPSLGTPAPPGGMPAPAPAPAAAPEPMGVAPGGMPPGPYGSPVPGAQPHAQAAEPPGVNPLGGTMVADASQMMGGGGFPGAPGGYPGAPPPAAGAPPGDAYGPPPAAPMGGQQGYGAPAPGPQGYGAPVPGPQGYGAPAPGGAPGPQGYGAPGPQAYGAPAPGGAPGPQGYGAPGGGGGYGAMVPAGGAAPAMRGAHGSIGTTRNPVMVTVLSMVCFIYGIIQFLGMFKELQAFRQKDDLSLIKFLIPVLGILELLKLAEKVAETKQQVGAQKPAASFILYFLLGPYFFADDLNDIWQAAGGGHQQLPPA